MRLVSRGRGEKRDLVVVFYLGRFADRSLKEAAPSAIIVNDTTTPTKHYTHTGPGGIPPLANLRVWARERSGALSLGRVIALGYSAGCQGLRAWLLNGDDPDAVVAVDGTHCSANPQDWQIDPWREYADRARGGERIMLASHTQIIPPTYTGTRDTLELVTGWELPRAPKPAPVITSEGQLAIYSYPGRSAKAHARQAQNVAGELLGAAMAMLGPLESPEMIADTEPAPPPAWQDPELTIGERAAEFCLEEMRRGVKEQPPGSNGGPRIREYFRGATRNGQPLHLESGNWCAAAQCFADRQSALSEERPPSPWVVSGIELQRAAAVAGTWRPAAAAREGQWHPRRGDLCILLRGNQPSWQRHVCRVLEVDGAKMLTIGANEHNEWRVTERLLSASRLAGFIEYPRRHRSAVEPWLANYWLELSDDITAGRYGLGEALQSLDDGTG